MGATWRPDPFEKETRYKVKKSFRAYRESFRAGEVLVYQNSAYSIHENMSGFFFLDNAGKWRSWDVGDEESMDIWSELFERI